MICKLGKSRATLVVGMLLLLASCARSEPHDWVELQSDADEALPELHITGTVHYLDIEGGLYVIRDAEGTTYHPTNLPEAFRVEGLAVEAVSKLRDDLASIGMVGPMVDLTRIRVRSGTPAGESTERETASERPLGAAAPELLGSWMVVGHAIPGTSAMSDAEAAAWKGRKVHLAEKAAISEPARCVEPTYSSQSVETDDFLVGEFNLHPGTLTSLESPERLTVLNVFCDGVNWAAMGGRLVAIDDERALAPWDGVFFELARVNDSP